MDLKRNKNLILYLFTTLFFAVFYYFLPFAGDDWAWGSSIGIDRLKSAFDGYNGRYLGNLLIILITRSVIAKVAFCALTMFLLIFVLSKIFDNLPNAKNSTTNYIIAFSSVLVLVLPNQITVKSLQPFQIFGSTIGWLSGFTNYVVPTVLILVFYYFVTNKKFESNLLCVLLVFDGLFACLCVEHYTLFCLMFSFAVIAYRYYFYKKICKKSISFFIGSLVGALIMFSNSSYQLMQKGDVSNNQRAAGFIGSLKRFGSYIFAKTGNQTLVPIFEIVVGIGIISFLIFFFIKTYKTIKNRNVAKLLPIICLIFMTIPLLFTNSGKEIYIIAPRCYILQYFMFVIYIYSKFAKNCKVGKNFDKALKLIFTLLILVTVVTYCRLDYMGIVRDNTVNEAINEDSSTVEVVEYPKSIEHIQWASNFIDDETYLERYQNFKNIPKVKQIKVISSNE
jgi:hypothetical protein